MGDFWSDISNADFTSEADVELRLTIPLLHELEYDDHCIASKYPVVFREGMCAFTVDFDRREMGYSPDWVGALVWVLTELMIEDGGERRLFVA